MRSPRSVCSNGSSQTAHSLPTNVLSRRMRPRSALLDMTLLSMPPTLLDVAVLAELPDRARCWRETVLREAGDLREDWPSRWNGASVALLSGLNRGPADRVDRGLAMRPRSPRVLEKSPFFRRLSTCWLLCRRLNIAPRAVGHQLEIDSNE